MSLEEKNIYLYVEIVHAATGDVCVFVSIENHSLNIWFFRHFTVHLQPIPKANFPFHVYFDRKFFPNVKKTTTTKS